MLLGAQILIIQNINLTGYLIPLPYVLFLLSLPFETNKIIVLLLGFLTGIVMDHFYDASGLHASACTLMGFSRYYVLKYISPRDGYDVAVKPTIEDMGNEWYLRYAGTLVLIHHFALFNIEMFRLSAIFSNMARVILSSAITILFIYLIQYIFFRRKERAWVTTYN